MPVDPKVVYYKADNKAKGRVVTLNGEVKACRIIESPSDGEAAATGIGRIPHWATCSSGSLFNKDSENRK